MNNPKEKAKELISKFTFMSIPESNAKFYNPKQCALIAVEEIKEQLIQNLSNDVSAIHAIYWEKVKTEIINL